MLDGTWSSGDLPQEIIDFQLMHPDGMHWSWSDLEVTPPYVKAYCIRFLNAIAEWRERNKPSGT